MHRKAPTRILSLSVPYCPRKTGNKNEEKKKAYPRIRAQKAFARVNKAPILSEPKFWQIKLEARFKNPEGPMPKIGGCNSGHRAQRRLSLFYKQGGNRHGAVMRPELLRQ